MFRTFLKLLKEVFNVLKFDRLAMDAGLATR